MPDYKALIAQNNALWTSARFHQETMATARAVAVKICAPNAVAVYKQLQALTAVPWWVIGVIHYRECGLSWRGNIAQGDPWNQVSRHDPRGRGPFKSFVQAAVDALSHCAPFAARWKDWTPGGALTLLELYNGLGYERHGTPSPYVWSGTTNYRHGKFVADHVYDANAVDKQLGCAILLHAMQEIDASVMSFGAGPNPDEYPEPPLPTPDPREAATDEDAVDPPMAATPVSYTEPAPPASSMTDTVKDKAKEMATDAASNAVSDPGTLSRVKSMFASKIAWLQGTAATAAAGAATTDDSVWTEFGALMHKPMFWFLVVIVISVALTIFFRWYDHGRGAAK